MVTTPQTLQEREGTVLDGGVLLGNGQVQKRGHMHRPPSGSPECPVFPSFSHYELLPRGQNGSQTRADKSFS